jgi:hypothetical protein
MGPSPATPSHAHDLPDDLGSGLGRADARTRAPVGHPARAFGPEAVGPRPFGQFGQIVVGQPRTSGRLALNQGAWPPGCMACVVGGTELGLTIETLVCRLARHLGGVETNAAKVHPRDNRRPTSG